MDDIANTASASKGTVYSRYPTKEALFRAVIADRVAAWSAEASKEDWRRGNTLEQRLRSLAAQMMSWAASDEVRAFHSLIDGAPIGAVRALRPIREQSMIDAIAREIEEFTRADVRRPRNAQRIASDLMAMLVGWFRMETSIRTVSEREAVAFAHHAVDLILAARSAW
jgi:AcrR family transcriptional regulator